MQIPLMAGRGFTQDDTLDHPSVAIVNQSFARHFCGNVLRCVGRMMSNAGIGRTTLNTQIVGVVRDTKHQNIRADAEPTCFQPIKQDSNPNTFFIYLRISNDRTHNPNQMLFPVQHAMQQLDPALALISLRTMDEQIDDLLSNEHMISFLAATFGILAEFLAGIGLYGVLAYSTAQRAREIGIRLALGSSRLAIARTVLADVLKLAVIGIGASLPIAIALSRLLRSQLFGVSPADPLT